MSWVAVDVDGVECVYDLKPVRNFKSFIPCGDGEYVELPSGSIQKLIGRTLTWDDEAVELKEEK